MVAAKLCQKEHKVTAEGTELADGNMPAVQDSYKYLRVPQAKGNH